MIAIPLGLLIGSNQFVYRGLRPIIEFLRPIPSVALIPLDPHLRAGSVGGGIALGLSPVLRRATAPIVEFLRAMPAPALLPFALLVLGVGNDSKIFVIAFVCLWPILLNAVDGVSGVDPTLVDTGRVYRISASDRLRHVVLPAAAPQIFAGMRTSLSLALILMVISEMVASSNGIGYFVLQSQRSFAIPEMWSGIILLGVLGYAFNASSGDRAPRADVTSRRARPEPVSRPNGVVANACSR